MTNLVEKPNKVIGFYGTVLACEFAPVRDLGAKMFTTLVRKLKKKPFHSHILRTINALTRTWHNGKLSENEFHFDFGTYPLPIIECADEDDVYSDYFQDTEAACDGLARLLFYSCKGVRGCLHSFGGEKLSALLSQLVQSDHMTTTSRDENHSASTEVEHTIYLTGKIASECIRRVFRHLYVSNTAELWIRLSVALDPVIASWKAIATSTNSTTTSSTTTTTSALSVATYVLVEIFIFGLTFSKGRGVCDPSVRDAISDLLVAKVLELVQAYSSCHQSNSLKNNFSKSYLSDRMISLFNYVWILFPRSNKLVSSVQETNLLSLVFGLNSVAHPATIVSTQLISPMPKDLIKLHVMKPLLSSIAIDIRVNASLVDAVDVLMGLVDFRTNVVTLIQETQALLSGSESILSDLTVKCLEIIERVTSLGNIDNSEQNEMLRALVIIKWVFTILPKQTSESIASRPRSFKNHMFKLISKDFSHETTIKSSWVLITHIASVYCLLTDDYAAVVKTISDLFFSCPKSLSFVWSFVAVLESYYSMQLNSDPHIEAETVMQTFLDVSRIDMTISLAGEHLNTSSQWLRVGILRLLQYCPRVQMTDMSVKNSNKESNKNIVDRADVVAICIDICVLSLQVSAERDLTVKLSNLEVFVRSGRLPTAYLKIISAFCVGILSVKFATIWTPAIGVVQAVAATDEGEDIVWPIVLGAIQTLQTETLSEVHSLDSSDAIGSLTEADDGAMSVSPALARSAYFHCLYSEHSPMLSVKETDNSGSAKVEVDSRTDKETLYSLVWKVLELCPNITLKRSKVVVPMFLR